MRRGGLGLVLALFATLVWADSPTKVTAVYDLYRGELHLAEVTEHYQRQGATYQLRSVAKPVGVLALFRPETITTTSQGRVTPQGLRPQHHAYTRSRETARNSQAEFDWGKGEVTVSNAATQRTLPLSAGTQDRLSGMYQFMFVTLRAGQAVSFPLVNGLTLNQQHYAVSQGDACPLGPEALATWYLDNEAKPGESRTEIWLSKKQHALPCKIRMTEASGEQYVQQLRSLVVEP